MMRCMHARVFSLLGLNINPGRTPTTTSFQAGHYCAALVFQYFPSSLSIESFHRAPAGRPETSPIPVEIIKKKKPPPACVSTIYLKHRAMNVATGKRIIQNLVPTHMSMICGNNSDFINFPVNSSSNKLLQLVVAK